MFNYFSMQCSLKTALLLLIIGCIATKSYSQTNLVLNSSFEQYATCPQGYFHEHPDFWYQPDKGQSGYYNACRTSIGGIPNTGHGFQNAKTGIAMISIVTAHNNSNIHTYFQTKLADSLIKDKLYYAEFYTVSYKNAKYTSNNISLLLTNNVIYADTITPPSTNILIANPQVFNYGNPIIADTNNWIRVSAVYKANGGEQYLTIGNFKYPNQTALMQSNNTASNNDAAYFIDDVSVIPLETYNLKANAGRDTTIMPTDSAFIGTYTNGIDTLKWLENGTTAIDSTRPGFWVYPTVNTFYVLTQTVNGFTSSDTVYITTAVTPLKFISYTIQETSNAINEKKVTSNWQTANEINVSHFNIQRSINSKDYTTIAQQKAQNKSLNNYTYNDETIRNEQQETWFYRIAAIDNDGKTTYSTIQQVNTKHPTPNIIVFPNPAKDYVTIQCKTIKQIQITDCLGRVTMQLNNPTDHQTINTKQFLKGLYIIKCTTNRGEINTQKLIINN